MQHFIDDNSAYAFEFPEEFKDDLKPRCTTEVRLVGSVSDTLTDFRDSMVYTLPTRCKYSTFSEVERDYLKTLYAKLNPLVNPEGIPNSVFCKYSRMYMNGRTIGYSSSLQKASAPCIAMAEWDVDLYGLPPTTLADPTHPESNLRPVKVHHFAKVSVNIGEQIQYTVVAYVSWYYPHPNQLISVG